MNPTASLRPRENPRALRRSGGLAAALLAAVGVASGTLSHGASLPSKPVFERDIRPLLKTHCLQCHGEEEKPKGGVDLRQRRLMLTNSESGMVLVPGKPKLSRLLEVVASGEMPKRGKKLPPEQIALLERQRRDLDVAIEELRATHLQMQGAQQAAPQEAAVA